MFSRKYLYNSNFYKIHFTNLFKTYIFNGEEMYCWNDYNREVYYFTYKCVIIRFFSWPINNTTLVGEIKVPSLKRSELHSMKRHIWFVLENGCECVVFQLVEKLKKTTEVVGEMRENIEQHVMA